MHPFYDFGWGPWAWIMMVFMILFWVAIIVGIFFLIRYLVQQTRSAPVGGVPGGDTAMQILRERFAKGEISREEFEELKQALE